MKLRKIIIGLVLMGSLGLVGCDEVNDTSDALIDEGPVTETEVESDLGPDFDKGAEQFEIDNKNGGHDMQTLADNIVNDFNEGKISDIESYVNGYMYALYGNGTITIGQNKVELRLEEAIEFLLLTIGSSPQYNVNDLETKKKCAIQGIQKLMTWEQGVDGESLTFQEQGVVNGQIIFAVMQGHGTVGKAMYEPATGHVGYQINK